MSGLPSRKDFTHSGSLYTRSYLLQNSTRLARSAGSLNRRRPRTAEALLAWNEAQATGSRASSSRSAALPVDSSAGGEIFWIRARTRPP